MLRQGSLVDDDKQAMHTNAQSDEVLRKIGRNVLLFQQIEGLLKFLVANHRADDNTANFNARQQQRTEKIQKTQMMGNLVGQYTDGILSDVGDLSSEPEDPTQAWISFRFTTIGNSDFYESQRAEMKRVVDERNDLIHHFMPRWKPDCVEGMNEAAAYLDDQRERVLPTFEHLHAVSKGLADTRQALSAFMSSPQFQDQLELSWLQHSPLICLLHEVTIQEARDDGWTYLADAGRIARLQLPEAVTDMKGKYGYSTLKRVLVASELFDVFDEPLPGGGIRTLYRTKQSS